MMESKNEMCHNCKYRQLGYNTHGDRKLECHRFPPTPNFENENYVARYPVVYSNYWCGEWKKESNDE